MESLIHLPQTTQVAPLIIRAWIPIYGKIPFGQLLSSQKQIERLVVLYEVAYFHHLRTYWRTWVLYSNVWYKWIETRGPQISSVSCSLVILICDKCWESLAQPNIPTMCFTLLYLSKFIYFGLFPVTSAWSLQRIKCFVFWVT